MKTTTANFDNSAKKQPVVIIEIASVTRKYCSGTFGNITANHKKLISDWELTPTSVDLPRNRIKRGKATFTLLDEALDVSLQIGTNFFDNRDITFKFGYQDLDDTDFISFPEWRIVEIQHGSDKISWNFTCEDVSRFAADNVADFEQTTDVNVSGGITTSDTTITVTSTTGFIDPTTIPAEIKEYLNPGIKIDDEFMDYTAKAATTFTAGRRRAGTASVTHDDNSIVQQIVVCNDAAATNHPELLKILLHILLTTDDGSGHAFYDLASYDTAFKGFGLGMTAAEVNIDAIENVDGLLWYNTVSDVDAAHATRQPGVIAIEKRNAIEQITEILHAAGAFLYTDEDGKYTVGTFDPTEFRSSFSAIKTFTDDDANNFGYEIEWEPLNTIKLTSQKFVESSDTTDEYKLDESVTDYGAREKPFEVKNLFTTRQNVTDAWFGYNYLRRWFYIFGNPIGRFNLDTNIDNIIYEPNDLIDFTLTDEIDLQAATPARGWTTRDAMITGQTILLRKQTDSVVAQVRFTGFIWDILDEVTSFETDETDIAAGDMDDSTLDPTGSNGTATEAADAYIDFGGSPAAATDAFRVRITWDNPNTAAGEHNFFSIAIHSQNPAGTDLFTAIMHRRVRYSTDDALTITRDFFVVDEDLTATAVQRIKIDAFDLREDDSTTVPAVADRPQNMAVSLIRQTNLNKTISTL